MAELATGKGLLGSPDAAAAVAFAHLLDAETRREELAMKATGQGKSGPVAEDKSLRAASSDHSTLSAGMQRATRTVR